MLEIPAYCFFIQFPAFENISQILDNGAPVLIEKHANQFLGKQPDSLIPDVYFNAVLSCRLSEDQEVGGTVADLQLFLLMSGFLQQAGKGLTRILFFSSASFCCCMIANAIAAGKVGGQAVLQYVAGYLS